ncbi:hypothetical protein [Herbidospora sp. RD11066]
MTQDNRPQSWRPTAAERSTWTRDALRNATGLLLGPGGFILYLAGEYFYDRRHLLFGTGGTPLQAMNPQGEAIALRGGFGDLDAVPLLGGRGRGTRVLSITPSLTPSTRAMGLLDGDPVSVALSSRTVSSTRSGLIVPGRIGVTTRITVPGDDYSVAALGTRASALFTSKDPVIGTGTGTVAGPQVYLPLTGRTPFSAPRRPNALAGLRCPWCGQTVSGSAFTAIENCPKKIWSTGFQQAVAARRPNAGGRYCSDCNRYATYPADHGLWCRFKTFIDDL